MFGFRRSLLITKFDGRFSHMEMRCDTGVLMVAGEQATYVSSPASIGGKNTQSLHVLLTQDLNTHCAHTHAAG